VTIGRFVVLQLLTTLSTYAWAQSPPTQSAGALPALEIYGFVESDAIVDFNQNDPDWYDTNRPTQLPAVTDEFGKDGRFYISTRQSRFGVKASLPTSAGDVATTFEIDMVGNGPDAGLTTIRLRHAWGQWKQIGAGRTFSQFMDADVYPNRLELWGPSAMPTSRNQQVFWQPYRAGDSNLTVAIEGPGASADGGLESERFAFRNITVRFPVPDVTGHYRHSRTWGYIQVGGIYRYIGWDDPLHDEPPNLSGHVRGAGISISSNLKPTPRDIVRLQAIYGRGIENYINDAPIDVAVKLVPGNVAAPLTGQALPVAGIVAYLDHGWSDTWSTSVGYSRVDVTNSNGQLPVAFRVGQYATANLVRTPIEGVLIGGELQWAQRQNFSDGWTVNDYRFQFSFRYSFSYRTGS
jgi:hypothetical protein